jgi:hypothetical protein
MVRASFITLLGLALCLPARADELSLRVETMLKAGVDTPLLAPEFAALGEPVVGALITTFEREDAATYVRLRALSVLSELDDVRAGRLCARLIEDLAQPARTAADFLRSAPVLRRALAGLEARPGPLLQARSLLPLLRHVDSRVRAGAVRLLVRDHHDQVQVRTALTDLAGRDDSERVQHAIATASSGLSTLPRHPLVPLPRPTTPRPH